MSFGWRARIAYITPSVLEIGAYDFYRLAPEGVGLVGVTCNIKGWGRDQFERVIGEVYDISESLATRKVDFIVHGGALQVASQGPGFELELIKGIEERTGIPATNSGHSAMTAMQALGVERIGLVAPFPQEQMDSLEGYLEGSGWKVEATSRRDESFHALAWMDQRTMYEWVRATVMANPGIDGLYLPCPAWPILDVVQALEQDLQRPVVTSTAADLWYASTILGFAGLNECGGMLMNIRPTADGRHGA